MLLNLQLIPPVWLFVKIPLQIFSYSHLITGCRICMQVGLAKSPVDSFCFSVTEELVTISHFWLCYYCRVTSILTGKKSVYRTIWNQSTKTSGWVPVVCFSYWYFMLVGHWLRQSLCRLMHGCCIFQRSWHFSLISSLNQLAVLLLPSVKWWLDLSCVTTIQLQGMIGDELIHTQLI